MYSAESSLTPRLLEHLRCIADGCTVAETAKRMWLSAEGVKSARKEALYPKLGARNAAHAVHLAYEKGLLP